MTKRQEHSGHQPGSTIKPMVKLPKDPSDCWEYLGAVDKVTGYGKKVWHGKTYLAHRWLWMQLFGPIPDGLPLQNTCDNKSCMNPYHWGISTQANIKRDDVRTILTARDAVEIKRVPKALRATKKQRSELAHDYAGRFGCSKQLIYDIWAGRAWGRAKAPTRATLPHPDREEAHA